MSRLSSRTLQTEKVETVSKKKKKKRRKKQALSSEDQDSTDERDNVTIRRDEKPKLNDFLNNKEYVSYLHIILAAYQQP